jgi:cytochrome c biogenesis protein CcdA
MAALVGAWYGWLSQLVQGPALAVRELVDAVGWPPASALLLSQRLSIRVAPGSRTSAFLLGVAFSFAFCPTLFLLFFGLTVPLALPSAAGWNFPGLFAVGTALPLLAAGGMMALGLGGGERLVASVARWHRRIKVVAGVVFLAAGLHDTVLYWWL